MSVDVSSDSRVYGEVSDIESLKHVVEDYLIDLNADSKQPMSLVMFSDALKHVARIARILRQPQGSVLMVHSVKILFDLLSV